MSLRRVGYGAMQLVVVRGYRLRLVTWMLP